MQNKTYTIKDLCELSGYSRRTIRYYIQEGLLEPPAGRGRGGFYYDSHLNRLNQIRKLQNDGLPLSGIQDVLTCGNMPDVTSVREVWIRYSIADGIDLNIKKDIEEKERKKIEKIARIARSIMKGVKVNEGK